MYPLRALRRASFDGNTSSVPPILCKMTNLSPSCTFEVGVFIDLLLFTLMSFDVTCVKGVRSHWYRISSWSFLRSTGPLVHHFITHSSFGSLHVSGLENPRRSGSLGPEFVSGRTKVLGVGSGDTYDGERSKEILTFIPTSY